jgi:hypothetical protein
VDILRLLDQRSVRKIDVCVHTSSVSTKIWVEAAKLLSGSAVGNTVEMFVHSHHADEASRPVTEPSLETDFGGKIKFLPLQL